MQGHDFQSGMLTLRLIDPNDYVVLEDGQPIGRIRLARERSPAIWLWTVTVTIPGPPFGDAKTIDEAKSRFKAAWLAFKERVGPEALVKAYATMNDANRQDRYRR
jgi:hypothetical protein